MKRTSNSRRARYSDVDILRYAHITDKPEKMQLHLLSADAQSVIADASADGFVPVCVYWPDGKMAILLIPTCATMPEPEKIIAAYRQCEKTDKVFPEGDVTWAN